jgi:pimeloyl-ACP methyl ester carboxylesterase
MRIEGAGHWVHAEQPQAFLQTVGPFLSGGA